VLPGGRVLEFDELLIISKGRILLASQKIIVTTRIRVEDPTDR
jgi:hypothetical protein